MNMNTYPGKTGPLVTGNAVKCGYLGAWSPNPNLVAGTNTLLRVSDVLYLAELLRVGDGGELGSFALFESVNKKAHYLSSTENPLL